MVVEGDVNNPVFADGVRVDENNPVLVATGENKLPAEVLVVLGVAAVVVVETVPGVDVTIGANKLFDPATEAGFGTGVIVATAGFCDGLSDATSVVIADADGVVALADPNSPAIPPGEPNDMVGAPLKRPIVWIKL